MVMMMAADQVENLAGFKTGAPRDEDKPCGQASASQCM